MLQRERLGQPLIAIGDRTRGCKPHGRPHVKIDGEKGIEIGILGCRIGLVGNGVLDERARFAVCQGRSSALVPTSLPRTDIYWLACRFDKVVAGQEIDYSSKVSDVLPWSREQATSETSSPAVPP